MTATAREGLNGGPLPVVAFLETNPVVVAKMLAAADIWLLPQPQ
jgi:hypothetical protein